MIIKFIKKRCARCQDLFDIPNTVESRARDMMLEYYPCTHCGYVKTIEKHFVSKERRTPRVVINISGRCVDCSIPFSMIDHHARGRCKRCWMRWWRLNATKSSDFDNI